MRITSTQIDAWGRTKEAQAALPRLVRRLVYAAGPVTQGRFPAGDSTSLPGWDGELEVDFASPWVPLGKSFWEFSCEARVASKADRDYNKRTNQTPETVRKHSTLVLVSARRWTKEAQWCASKLANREWNAVRFYDAAGLEEWLEQSPAVALEFADELGLTGPGVESVARHWHDWASQSEPRISTDAVFVDRENVRDEVVKALRDRLKSAHPHLFALKADSVEEAAAFACASLLHQPDLMAATLVVTDPTGWRYVEKNPTIRVAIAARPDSAEKPVRRDGLAVVIPFAAGDMGNRSSGSDEMVLNRPRIREFEKALVALGLDEGEATRLAAATGRSWSVFRRRHSKNPGVRRPAWLDAPQSQALSTICLLGGWMSSNEEDRDAVSRLSGRTYEDVERDLQYLALLDDAPLRRIGDVWRAKSPLELFDLFGNRITRDELARFFDLAKAYLCAPDPSLELPDDQHFAAGIYGKVRPQSGSLLRSI